jgi:hypothetical protein
MWHLRRLVDLAITAPDAQKQWRADARRVSVNRARAYCQCREASQYYIF